MTWQPRRSKMEEIKKFQKDPGYRMEIGKRNENIFSNHQIALRSIFKHLVKWQQDFQKSRQTATRFKNLVKWQQDY